MTDERAMLKSLFDDAIDGLVTLAVKAERAACAQIAETVIAPHPRFSAGISEFADAIMDGRSGAGSEIAAAIRARGELQTKPDFCASIYPTAVNVACQLPAGHDLPHRHRTTCRFAWE